MRSCQFNYCYLEASSGDPMQPEDERPSSTLGMELVKASWEKKAALTLEFSLP